ncbi:MAG: hypothetical protein AMXMBFR84_46270 [Candidatus Hydrogenedentota bacterium]
MAVLPACASRKMTDQLASVQTAQEAGLAKPGTWQPGRGGLENVLPPIASMQDLAAAKDGIGISTAIVPGFVAQDIEAEADVEFDSTGAAAVCFRVLQEDSGLITSMYTVAVFSKGVHLWRLQAGRWSRLHSYFLELPVLQTHRVYVKVRRDLVTVAINGKTLFQARDSVLVTPGSVGVRASEGQCRFHSFRVKSLK